MLKNVSKAAASNGDSLDSEALKNYRFKNNIWNKIISAKDFEKFNEVEYFRFLEIYKDPQTNKDLLAINPITIEQKLALIEAIQIKFSHFHNLPNFQDEIERLNVFKLKKLQRIMKSFDLSRPITRENLQEFTSDFFLILKGPPLSLLDYFTKNKTELMNERLFRVLQEDMLLRGLKGTLEIIPIENEITKLDSARATIKRIMKYRLWRLLVIPYDLPWIDQIKISDDLLEKIFLDGLTVHESELIKELKNQNAIDHYERFRKVYRPVALGIGFYYYYNKLNKTMEESAQKENDDLKKSMWENLKKIGDAIKENEAPAKTEKDLKEEQYQRVLKAFKDKYHEDPTPEEKKELHLKIFGH